ncbi:MULTISPECIES: hypothetical protein [unclassified Luteimonas]
MTQTIDPVKLKLAAVRLRWVLLQYPESDDVRMLLEALTPLIEDAEAGRVRQIVDSKDVPGAYNFADGMYIPYEDPSVDEAYTSFRTELKGGLTEQDKRIIARIAAMQASINGSSSHG